MRGLAAKLALGSACFKPCDQRWHAHPRVSERAPRQSEGRDGSAQAQRKLQRERVLEWWLGRPLAFPAALPPRALFFALEMSLSATRARVAAAGPSLKGVADGGLKKGLGLLKAKDQHSVLFEFEMGGENVADVAFRRLS